MDEHRYSDSCSVLQEGNDALVVEIAIADMITDLDPAMSGGYAAVQLRASGVGILQWHLTERQELFVRGGTDLRRQIVEDAGDLDRLVTRVGVAEEYRRGRDDLHVDTIGVHGGERGIEVPTIVLDPAEFP